MGSEPLLRPGRASSVLFVFVITAESCAAAVLMARISFGPISTAPRPILWIVGAAFWLSLYLFTSLQSYLPVLRAEPRSEPIRFPLWASAIVPLVGSAAMLGALQFRPTTEELLRQIISPIQPFPFIASALSLLVIWLMKLAMVWHTAATVAVPIKTIHRASLVAVPSAFLLMGVLQSSVYIFPIGNAFLRFWAIADAIGTGTPYPVTLTEEGPVRAGSPPYVYDLPLFPMMLKAAFTIFGHNSAAAHLPAAIASSLFPISLYLLIARAAGSRPTAVIFASLGSLFPYLRFWVLNLPDPDPLLLTSACLAAYLYLLALDSPGSAIVWTLAGLAAGVLSLARPEGILYAGFLVLGILLSRPGARPVAIYLACLGAFLVPTVALWVTSFGFIWPQNYNRTLGLDYPRQNLEILMGMDSLGFYQRGLGLDPNWALGLLALFLATVLVGIAEMSVRDRRLLAFAVPGIGNTILIFFANPAIPNTFHFADFFRHDSFGIPFLVATSAYGLQGLWLRLSRRPSLKTLGFIGMLLLVGAVAREGDILANPTATHRPNSRPTQVLTTYTYLSMEAILAHPLPLPPMTYYRDGDVTVARPSSIEWPDAALEFFRPFDMSFDSNGRPFGYASVVASLVALCFALLGDGPGAVRGTAVPPSPSFRYDEKR